LISRTLSCSRTILRYTHSDFYRASAWLACCATSGRRLRTVQKAAKHFCSIKLRRLVTFCF